jgi:hypothetical protein
MLWCGASILMRARGDLDDRFSDRGKLSMPVWSDAGKG